MFPLGNKRGVRAGLRGSVGARNPGVERKGTWGPLTRILKKRKMKSQILLSHFWQLGESPVNTETRPQEVGLCLYYAIEAET